MLLATTKHIHHATDLLSCVNLGTIWRIFFEETKIEEKTRGDVAVTEDFFSIRMRVFIYFRDLDYSR